MSACSFVLIVVFGYHDNFLPNYPVAKNYMIIIIITLSAIRFRFKKPSTQTTEILRWDACGVDVLSGGRYTIR